MIDPQATIKEEYLGLIAIIDKRQDGWISNFVIGTIACNSSVEQNIRYFVLDIGYCILKASGENSRWKMLDKEMN